MRALKSLLLAPFRGAQLPKAGDNDLFANAIITAAHGEERGSSLKDLNAAAEAIFPKTILAGLEERHLIPGITAAVGQSGNPEEIREFAKELVENVNFGLSIANYELEHGQSQGHYYFSYHNEQGPSEGVGYIALGLIELLKEKGITALPEPRGKDPITTISFTLSDKADIDTLNEYLRIQKGRDQIWE